MAFQTILQLVAMLSVLTCIVIITIGAFRFRAGDISELWRQINGRPVMGPLLRMALPLALASMVLEALMRVVKLF